MERTSTHPLSPEEAKERLRQTAAGVPFHAPLSEQVKRRPAQALLIAFVAGLAAGRLRRHQWEALGAAAETALPYLLRRLQ